MEDIYARVRERAERGERSLIITLTKKMAEELSEYLAGLGLKDAIYTPRWKPSNGSKYSPSCAPANSTSWWA
jgi:hypothetical protein